MAEAIHANRGGAGGSSRSSWRKKEIEPGTCSDRHVLQGPEESQLRWEGAQGKERESGRSGTKRERTNTTFLLVEERATVVVHAVEWNMVLVGHKHPARTCRCNEERVDGRPEKKRCGRVTVGRYIISMRHKPLQS